MVYMEKELETAHVIEERRINFEQFIKDQAAKKNPGMIHAALHNQGFRDSFGPVVFDNELRKGLWVISDAGNDRVVIYTNRDEALAYAKSLVPIMKLYGYMFSKAWVQQVVVRHAFPHAYSGLMSPSELWEEDDRYIIRLRVQ